MFTLLNKVVLFNEDVVELSTTEIQDEKLTGLCPVLEDQY